MEGYEQLRFPLNSELACLVNKCMLPFLRELLLENNDSYYIFLAMELQFHQCTNWEDICTRWSSFRHVKQLLETLITQKHKSRITLHIFTFFFFFLIQTSFFYIFRNSSWFLTHLFNDEQRLEFIMTIMSDFLEEVFCDIDSMEVMSIYILPTNRHTNIWISY